jgi:DNA invertase Pin-like site-specific DNA recombinase
MPKFKFNDARTAVALVRVSKEEQELSPEAQAFEAERYCQAHGITLAAVFIERITSVTPLEDRDGLQAALQALRPLNAGILLFLNRDRISRDVVLTKLIEREAIKQGAIVTTTNGLNGDTPQDEMLKTIMDAVAQYEREYMIVKTKAALAAKRRRGEYIGAMKYGYRWHQGALVPNPDEQAIIQRVKALAAQGMSAPMISRTLGPINRRGKHLGKTQVLKLIHLA